MAKGKKRNHLQNKLVLELQTKLSVWLFDWLRRTEILFVNKIDLVGGGKGAGQTGPLSVEWIVYYMGQNSDWTHKQLFYTKYTEFTIIVGQTDFNK